MKQLSAVFFANLQSLINDLLELRAVQEDTHVP
ncbi:hypothetical protein M2315_005213 [Agrobacterium fabrum]|nr:hypothetical protein [Agrobacterium fabrum]